MAAGISRLSYVNFWQQKPQQATVLKILTICKIYYIYLYVHVRADVDIAKNMKLKYYFLYTFHNISGLYLLSRQSISLFQI